MAGVEYTFNLGPVSETSLRSTRPEFSQDNSNVAAAFEQAQAASVRSSEISGQVSPACDGGRCIVMHGDGPGVTTLSVGEEGGAGDFLTLPVVDGVAFLEPPATSFAASGEAGPARASIAIGETAPPGNLAQGNGHEVTTLAIGEEDGGYASAETPSIGSGAHSPYEMQPHGVIETTSVGGASAPAPVVAEGYGTMEPIYSPLDARFQGSGTQTAFSAEPAVVPTTPIESGPAAPREKPVSIATAGAPVPDAKPGAEIAAPIAASTTTPMPNAKPDIGPSAPTATVEAVPIPAEKPAAEPIAATAVPEASGEVVAASETRTSLPFEGGLSIADILQEAKQSGGTKVEGGTISVGDYDAYMAAEGTTPATGRYEFGDAQSEGSATVAGEDIVPAQLRDPSSSGGAEPVYSTEYDFGTPPPSLDGNGAGASTETGVAMEELPEPVYSTTFSAPPAEVQGVEGSSGDVMPAAPELDAGGAERPALTEEDFRITTLALGEEEAGGG